MESGGKYYFEIKVDKGSLLKIGVTRPNNDFRSIGFCDTENGWGIYNGELRHGGMEKAGIKYAQNLELDQSSKIDSGDLIGVMVDMVNGTLGYSKNGVYLGIAFYDIELSKGSLYPAVATIYCEDSFSVV